MIEQTAILCGGECVGGGMFFPTSSRDFEIEVPDNKADQLLRALKDLPFDISFGD